MAEEETSRDEDEKKMKREIQRWFDIISSNPILIRDEEILLFVESDFGVSFPYSFVNLSILQSTTAEPPQQDSNGKPRNSLRLLPMNVLNSPMPVL